MTILRMSMPALLSGLVMSPLAAIADDSTDNTISISIQANIEEMVAVEVGGALVDGAIGIDVDSVSSTTTDTTDDIERAVFVVQANTDYDITVGPAANDETWSPSDIVSNAGDYLKLDGTDASNDHFIAAEVFLDSDITASGTNDITDWDTSNGEVSVTDQSAGTKTWGLGVIIRPDYVGNSSNTNGADGVIAPADSYRGNVTVTVALSS